MDFSEKKTCSIIVTYDFNEISLKFIVKKHLLNFKNIIIVNNSPKISLQSIKSPKITVINNASNVGLATALNIGILESKKKGFNLVALFDQDTLLPDDFAFHMLKNINAFQDDKRPALFSPVFFDQVTNDYGSLINFKPLRLYRSKPHKNNYIKYPQYVITSGSFIPISVIDDVGLMLNELFIDFVDIEWCLRARSKGYEIVAYPQLVISHNLGDYSIPFFGVNYPIHSPVRMYYYFRNAIYLYQLKGIDMNWKLIDATRNIFRFLFYILFVKQRKTYFRYIIKGYYHGFIKKMGKYK